MSITSQAVPSKKQPTSLLLCSITSQAVPSKKYTVGITALILKNIPMPISLTQDIWFVVRVPVLSEQMTVVQPRVSTEGSFLNSTCKVNNQASIKLLPVHDIQCNRLLLAVL